MGIAAEVWRGEKEDDRDRDIWITQLCRLSHYEGGAQVLYKPLLPPRVMVTIGVMIKYDGEGKFVATFGKINVEILNYA